MTSERTSTKKKLTLSVDEAVVARAKEMGLNLSDMTEKILQGFVFVPSSDEKAALYTKYGELFRSMLPLMKEYDASVKVAYETVEDQHGVPLVTLDIYLQVSGEFYREDLAGDGGSTFTDVRKISTFQLLPPKEILSNFIMALAKAKTERNERLAELEMAQKIIEVVTSTVRKTKGEK